MRTFKDFDSQFAETGTERSTRLARERKKRQAAKLKASGYQIDIRVHVPAGMRVSVDKVLGIDDDGILHDLQVVGASVVKD